jgi:tRNA(Leu) C34 or U34 (ribose-2'-O)-methylase TrmL
MPVFDAIFPWKSAFFFGEEMEGLLQEDIDVCNGPTIYIPQYGSVRSINVAQAAAIVNYEYAKQHRDSLK